MNWLLKVMAYIAIVLATAIVKVVLANVLGIETTGSTEARVIQGTVEMLLAWALLVALLEFYGAKITWPN